ncbi:hypothetical protein [Nocardia brasiliensis]|uniref:hypothetical protein n=1 Tax=Nocardia brasiliensis TaxID=37326 RepID=UPI0033FE9D09
MSELLRLPDGRVIAAGDGFRDTRRPDPRLLRVEAIADTSWRDWTGVEHYNVTLVVVRRDPDGTEVPVRKTVIDADRLLDLSNYTPVRDEDANDGPVGGER